MHASQNRRAHPWWEVESTWPKKALTSLKIMAPGGQATPAPPLGPALGAAGVNPGQFIQQFNEKTRDLNGKVVGCLITVYEDRSFEFEIKSSPASVLIKEAAKIEKGSGEPHVNKVGKITMDQCREIAKEKGEDLNSHDIDAGAMIIAGTARSMGVEVEGD
jgi:large subunit ribosomal protein L11